MSYPASEFLDALAPIVERLGASIIDLRSCKEGDEPVEWQGSTVAYLRPSQLRGALERVVSSVEREIGASLANMERSQKQVAIRLLDERGAFLLRGAAEDVAGWMGVSKVTIYSYLNAIERADS